MTSERTWGRVIWTTLTHHCPESQLWAFTPIQNQAKPRDTEQNISALLRPLFGDPCSLTAHFLPPYPELWIQNLLGKDTLPENRQWLWKPTLATQSSCFIGEQTAGLTRQMGGSPAGWGVIADGATPRPEHWVKVLQAQSQPPPAQPCCTHATRIGCYENGTSREPQRRAHTFKKFCLPHI